MHYVSAVGEMDLLDSQWLLLIWLSLPGYFTEAKKYGGCGEYFTKVITIQQLKKKEPSRG
jgi:hypothetical protein